MKEKNEDEKINFCFRHYINFKFSTQKFQTLLITDKKFLFSCNQELGRFISPKLSDKAKKPSCFYPFLGLSEQL